MNEKDMHRLISLYKANKNLISFIELEDNGDNIKLFLECIRINSNNMLDCDSKHLHLTKINKNFIDTVIKPESEAAYNKLIKYENIYKN